MIKYIDQLEENFKAFPNRIAVRSEENRRGLSYGELDLLSAKVYSFLYKNGIGKEKMVLIALPRGQKIITALIGVLKAGAAFTIVEDTYPAERIEFIRKDCSCSLLIDSEVYEDMMQCDPMMGHAKTAEHDACFAVYTSGSTGNPKGVLHEYGKIENLLEEIVFYTKPVSIGCKFAIISPFHYIVSLFQLFYSFYYGKCLWIIAIDTAKNPAKFIHLMNDEKIEETFLAPSFLKFYRNQVKSLTNVFTGGEPCTDLYFENLNIINSYASSEAGMMTTFRLDKKYAKPPVGTNHIGARMYIAGDNGEELEKGETGEIYFQCDFTRGYINLPEKNRIAFVDGMYHTGDIGFINENGVIVAVGRKDEMIKIDGNRIEPAEIEAAIRKTIGISNVVAKGFSEGSRAYICVYLLQNELKGAYLLDKSGKFIFSANEMKKKLSSVLPSYMIPTYYLVLSSFPMFGNGKIKKKDLRAPRTENFLCEYVAPRNEKEKYFCDLFAKCLDLERVGIKDDFYQIGGDSGASIRLVGLSDVYAFNVSQVYDCRTPEKLAELLLETQTSDRKESNERNRRAMTLAFPLLPEMTDVLEYNKRMPNSTMWNLPIFLTLKEHIDVNRLAAAFDRVFRHHPAFCTQIDFNENYEPLQMYRPESYENIQIERISEAQLEELKPKLAQPFTVRNTRFFRSNIFVTEKASYLFFDIHHIITDGYSLNLVLGQIEECYNNPESDLPDDYYYLLLDQNTDCAPKNDCSGAGQYFVNYLEKLKSKTYSILPATDFDSILWEYGCFEHRLSKSKQDFACSEAGRYVGENKLFIAALSMAIAAYNQTEYSALQWIYNGRDSAESLSSAGLLLKSLQIFSLSDKDETVEKYLTDISSQVEYTIAHNNVKISSVIGNELEDTVFFMYQNDLYNPEKFDYVEKAEKLSQQFPASDSFMEVEIVDNGNSDDFVCTIKYSASHFKASSIERLFGIFDRTVTELISEPNLDKTKLGTISDKIKNL